MEYISTIIVIFILAIIYFFYRGTSQKHKTAIENVFEWFIFSVVFALTPIALNAIVSLISGQSITTPALLSRGELLLVSTSISADAAGKLIGAGQKERLLKLFAAGGCMLIVFLASFLFATIASSSIEAFNIERIAKISIFVFFLTMLAGTFSVILSEMK